jgi:glycosyltransferase involved in cell wall biosynthesis
MINFYNGSCEYFTIKQPSIASGVTKKINNIVDSLNSIGVTTKLSIYNTKIKDLYYFICGVVNSKSEIIVIRFPGVNRTVLLAPFILFKKLKGHKIVLDLPTPLIVTLQEIRVTNTLLGVIYRWIPILLFYPWVLIPYSRIIQSGQEHPYFLFTIKSITKLIGNGINVDSIKQVSHENANKDKIVMICVAQLEIWHGYDRLLISLSNYFKTNKNAFKNLELIIVGDGNEKKNLMDMCESLGLANFVTFTGNLTGTELDDVFSKADIAVASLGSYRVNLKTSSPLKSREYTARGLPFLSADNDPDFQTPIPFMYKVANDSSVIGFDGILSWYNNLLDSGYDFNEIREFAFINLDFKKKVEQMFLF